MEEPTMPEPDAAHVPRQIRMMLRFSNRRTARAASRAWLGTTVAAARAPKRVAATTRLAPTALPARARPAVQLARAADPPVAAPPAPLPAPAEVAAAPYAG